MDDASSEFSEGDEHEGVLGEHGGPPVAHALGQADPVEAALADALQRAALVGAWDAVQVLTSELRARREARAGVTSLDAARAKRGGKV